MLTPGSIIEHNFILDLPLTWCEKQIYALIYSFTVGDFGICFASKSRLAELSRCSQSSVYRAFTRLLALGFIEKATVGKYHGVRALVFESTLKDSNRRSESSAVAPPTASEKARDDVKEAEVNSEDESTSLEEDEKGNTALTEKERYFREYMKVFGKYSTLPPPKYSFLGYGNHKNVLLTEKQYEALLLLAGYDRLSLYISRLDALIKNNEKTGKPPPHSAYRTLKKWINNDLGT